MTALEKSDLLSCRFALRFPEHRGIGVKTADVLRRAQMVLHRWAEQECGDSNAHASWCIERDEATDKPYKNIYFHNGRTVRYQCPDREKGALKRVAAVCRANNLHFYHQTDPRGCALYISPEPLTEINYTNGMAVCV